MYGSISSCFVHLRKPDTDTLLLGMDIENTHKEQIMNIENTSKFLHLAQGLGISSTLQESHQSTHLQQLGAYCLISDKKTAPS